MNLLILVILTLFAFAKSISFSDLSSKFEDVKDLSIKQLGDYIGGKVKVNIDNGTFENGCAIRMSYAINYAGLEIKNSDDISVVSGDDKKWYIYRVKDLKTFIDSNFSDKETVKKLKDLDGKKGIIIFENCNFSNATGHADLFDGTNVLGSDYSNSCNSIILYKID